MSPPDLSAARGRALACMNDACRITRNPQGRRDAAVDPVSLALVDDAATVVYEGPCSLNTDNRRSLQRSDTLAYRAIIPHDAPIPRAGDTLVLTASGDAFMVGRPMTVTNVDARSHVVVRMMSLHLSVPAQAVP